MPHDSKLYKHDIASHVQKDTNALEVVTFEDAYEFVNRLAAVAFIQYCCSLVAFCPNLANGLFQFLLLRQLSLTESLIDLLNLSFIIPPRLSPHSFINTLYCAI